MAGILEALFPGIARNIRQAEGLEQARQIFGQQGQQYQPGAGQGMLQNIPSAGLLGGKITPAQAGMQLLSVPGYEQMGMNLLQQFSPKPQAPTTEAQNLIAMGLTPGTPEFNQAMNRLIMPTAGTAPQITEISGPEGVQKVWAYPGTGKTVPIGLSGKPPTQNELESAGYLQRMIGAEGELSKLEQQGYSPLGWETAKATVGGLANLPLIGGALQPLGNVFASPEYQQQKQAEIDWARAKLRSESGATIGEQEAIDEANTYFPRTGDSPAVIKQKAEARQRAVEAMRRKAGSAGKGILGEQQYITSRGIIQQPQSSGPWTRYK